MRWMIRLAVLCAVCACDAGARADAEPPDAATASLATLSATGDSLGPIARTTPFAAAEFRRLFPEAVVTDSVASAEGEPIRILRIATPDGVILDARSSDGARVHSVEIRAGPAADPWGKLFGRTYQVVFEGVAGPRCSPGMEEESGLVLCDAPSLPHVVLVFAGSWDGPDGQLPPGEVLAGWMVERVIWRP